MQTIKEGVEAVAEKFSGALHTTEGMTRMTGQPIAENKNSLTAGPTGPVLMQDYVLLEKLTEFTREKIPARNVHALGAGCYGVLRVKNDISKYTKAKVFTVGKETPLFARFSGIFTEQGDPETNRDPRGFALKFYTEEGNWDLLAINTPVFNVRDAKPGPDVVHAFKRDPRTANWYPTQTWDYVVNHPEGLHMMMMVYTDRGGTPMSYRCMHAYGSNTFSFINSNNERFWVKFHLVSQQGAKGFDQVTAKLIAGEDPNFLSRDLHEAIEKKAYPKWKLCVQVMPEDEGYKYPWTFDCTKVWKHSDYPLIEIGEIELNRNVVDYFTEVEQVAFSPLNVVPGIGFSPDKLLQGRLLIYDDAQHHRLGPNFKMMPTNRPRCPMNPYYRVGGFPSIEVKDRFPHYHPSNYGKPVLQVQHKEPPYRVDGPAGYYDYPDEGSDRDYYEQCRDFWRILSDTDKDHMCQNIAVSLSLIPDDLANQCMSMFNKVDKNCSECIQRYWTDCKQGRFKSEGRRVWENANRFLQSV